MKRLGWLVALVACAGTSQGLVKQTQALPLDPVSSIVAAFRSHAIVAFPDVLDRRVPSLIANPEFATTVNDLVVDFGNARYQSVMDRFQRGDAVPDVDLRRIWLESTNPQALWKSAQYEEFVRKVRDINRGRPLDRQLRVLLGDPPIDWNAVRSATDFTSWASQRDSYPADLIRSEVLAKNRRALLLFNPMRYQRQNVRAGYASDGPGATLVSRLERGAGTKVFTIWPTDRLLLLDTRTLDWNDGLVLLRGTRFGAVDFDIYFAPDKEVYGDARGGYELTIPRRGPDWRAVRMEDQFDAVLIRLPEPAVAPPSSDVFCADQTLIKTVLERMALASASALDIERLTTFCSPLQRTLQAMNPDIRQLDVVASIALASGRELQVIVAKPVDPYGSSERPTNYAGWNAGDVLAVVLRGPGAGAATVLFSEQHKRDDCCGVSVLKLTTSEVVVSRSGEKLLTLPNLKFFFDDSTSTLARRDFDRFPAHSVRDISGAPEFLFHDYKQIVHIRPTLVAPFIEVAGPPRPMTEQDRPVYVDPFASANIPGFTLPQSPGIARNGVAPQETIGPTARDGTKIWFAKRFGANSGSGAFGYFDTATSKYEMFQPPEIRDYAAESLKVETDTIWIGLAEYGDMGGTGYGLLRLKRPGLQADVIPVAGLITSIVRFGDRLYLATEEEVAILFPDGHVEGWFVDVGRDGRLRMSRLWRDPVRRQ